MLGELEVKKICKSVTESDNRIQFFKKDLITATHAYKGGRHLCVGGTLRRGGGEMKPKNGNSFSIQEEK